MDDAREEWRPVPGFERYQVSDLGRVRGPCGIMRGCLHKKGYRKVTLCRAGLGSENRLVHELLLLAFRGPRPVGMESRHINDCKTDDRLTNLVYGTVADNVADAIRNGKRNNIKLSLMDVRGIRKRCCRRGDARNLAREYGVSVSQVRRIARGNRWAGVA